MAHDIPLTSMKSDNAGDVSYSVERVSGSTEISAAITGTPPVVRITVPSEAAEADRNALFRITADVACIHDPARTDTDSKTFWIRVPGIGPPPAAPSLVLVGVTEGTGFSVRLNLVAGSGGGAADSYTVQRSMVSDFSTVESEQTRSAAGSVSFTVAFDDAGTHYFRARSSNVAGMSDWSGTLTVELSRTPVPVPTVTVTPFAQPSLGVNVSVSGHETGQGHEYEVQYAAESNFGSPVDVTLTNFASGNVSLPSTGTWHFRARIVEGARVSDWSASVSVSVTNPDEVGPPSEVPFTATVSDGDVTVTVGTPATGAPATSWTINWGVDNTFAVGTATLTSPGAHVIGDAQDIGGTLWLQVFASNDAGDGTTSFLIVNTYPTPTVTYDPAMPLAGETVTATFSSIATITQYEWQRLGSDGTTWQNLAGETTRSYTIPDDTAPGTQFRIRWRRSQVGIENGPALAVAEPPPPPGPMAPGLTVRGGSTPQVAVATVTAPDEGPTPTSYQIQRAENAAFTGVTTSTTLPMPGDAIFSIVAGTTYYYRARGGYDDGSFGPWSDTVVHGSVDYTFAVVVYDPPEEVVQGATITATLPTNAENPQWQLFRMMEWQDIPFDSTGLSYETPETIAVGAEYRITWTVGGVPYASSNVVTVIPYRLLVDDLPTGLEVLEYDEESSNADDWRIRLGWTWPRGATRAGIEIDHGNVQSILTDPAIVTDGVSVETYNDDSGAWISYYGGGTDFAKRFRVRAIQAITGYPTITGNWTEWSFIDYEGAQDYYQLPTPAIVASANGVNAARVVVTMAAVEDDVIALSRLVWRVERVFDQDSPPTFDDGADETVERDATTLDATTATFDFSSLPYGHHAFRALMTHRIPEITSAAYSAVGTVIVEGPPAEAPDFLTIRERVGNLNQAVTDGVGGTTADLRVTFSGGDYDTLEFAWSVTAGTLDDATSATPVWTRPMVTEITEVTISLTLTARASRPSDTSDTASATATADVHPALTPNEVILGGTRQLSPLDWRPPWIPINRLLLSAGISATGVEREVGFGISGIKVNPFTGNMELHLREGVSQIGVGGTLGEFLTEAAEQHESLITLIYDGTEYVFAGPGAASNRATDDTNPWEWQLSTAQQAVAMALRTAISASGGEESVTMRLNEPGPPTPVELALSDWTVPAGHRQAMAAVVVLGSDASGTDAQLWHIGNAVGMVAEGSLAVDSTGYSFDGCWFRNTAHMNIFDADPRTVNAMTLFETGGSHADATLWVLNAVGGTALGVTMAAIGDGNIGGAGVNVRDSVTGGAAWINAFEGLSAGDRVVLALTQPETTGLPDAVAPTVEITTASATPPNATAPTVGIMAIPSGESGTQVQLAATLSGGTYDTVEYAWSATGGSFDDATSATPTWTRPTVTADTDYTVSLIVTARGTGTNAAAGTSATGTDSETASVTAPVGAGNQVTVGLGTGISGFGALRWADTDAFSNDDLTALSEDGTSPRWLNLLEIYYIGVDVQLVIATSEGGRGGLPGHELSDAWEANASALTFSCPGIANDLVLPGPTASGVDRTDTDEPYSWALSDTTAMNTWATAYNALTDAQKAQATCTFSDGS